jgi:hypothetical protein
VNLIGGQDFINRLPPKVIKKVNTGRYLSGNTISAFLMLAVWALRDAHSCLIFRARHDHQPALFRNDKGDAALLIERMIPEPWWRPYSFVRCTRPLTR